MKIINKTGGGKHVRYILFYCNLYRNGYKRLAKMLYWLNRIVFTCDIPPSVKIGRGLTLPHFGMGVVIHPWTVIGDNVKIYQQVTIGVRKPGVGSKFIIGDGVLLGCGCKILGSGCLNIGKGAKIGANSVVIDSVPDGATMVGIPAKPI